MALAFEQVLGTAFMLVRSLVLAAMNPARGGGSVSG
jgi:hypothetical protein